MSVKDSKNPETATKTGLIKKILQEPATWVLVPTTFLTIGGLYYLYSLVLSRSPCVQGGNDFANRLACLDLNEVGDLFAGAFAPIAFLWLMAAVALQSLELRAQRIELRESRVISDEQKEAAKLQARALERLSEILGSQSEANAEVQRFNTALNNIGLTIRANQKALQTKTGGDSPPIVDQSQIATMKPHDIFRHAASVIERWDRNNQSTAPFVSSQMKDPKGYNLFRDLVVDAARVARELTGDVRSTIEVETVIELEKICERRFLD